MGRSLTTLLLSLGLATAVNLHAAQKGMYKWYDKNGTVQFSDQPPQGIHAEFIPLSGVGPTPSKPDTAKAGSSKGTDNGQKTPKVAAKSKPPAKMEVLPKKDPAMCKQAKDDLRTLENAPRVRITEQDGSQHFMTGKERDAQKDKIRKTIKVRC